MTDREALPEADDLVEAYQRLNRQTDKIIKQRDEARAEVESHRNRTTYWMNHATSVVNAAAGLVSENGELRAENARLRAAYNPLTTLVTDIDTELVLEPADERPSPMTDYGTHCCAEEECGYRWGAIILGDHCDCAKAGPFAPCKDTVTP